MLLEPVLMSLDGQGADQAQAALRVGKDPHHLGAAFNFLVLALEHVGALEMLVMLALGVDRNSGFLPGSPRPRR